MKNQLLPMADKLLLRRALIETIIDQLKNISQLNTSQPRQFCGQSPLWIDCLLPPSKNQTRQIEALKPNSR